MIFAADIGGTNARLGLFERSGTRLGAIATKTYPSGQHASLEEIVERFHGRASGSAETRVLCHCGTSQRRARSGDESRVDRRRQIAGVKEERTE